MRMPVRWTVAIFALLLVPAHGATAEQVPSERWNRYVDPAEAGFDPAKLALAEELWSELPSSAFMVVSNGAVVAAWGDVERRFMCHSVRKSFLSALYGIYWDRGEVDLNKTMADLGIDEPGGGLLETERQARILDLLKARSGVFHPAAYAGRTDSQARGSQGPGRYFAYNNWDFNTLATILIEETGDDVFGAFDEHFAQPLAMEDWRVTDGYYHYERDKSRYPAYPFRLSARDAARFGLLFAREGQWGGERVLSRHWVRRSSALYSIDDERFGYGFMWWVAREPRLERYGMYAALGVGNQMIAVLPDIDLVIVNRADTYDGERTPMDDLLGLIEQILAARTGEPAESPRLEPLGGTSSESFVTRAPDEALEEMVGEWPYPPPPLGLEPFTEVEIRLADGHLVTFSEVSGTFKEYLQPDGWLVEEDSHERYLPIRDDAGTFAGLADTSTVIRSALHAVAEGDAPAARKRMALVSSQGGVDVAAGELILELMEKPAAAERSGRALLETADHRQLERNINFYGYTFLRAGKAELAEEVFLFNTRLFPEAYNTWDSLAESQAVLGKSEQAIANYRRTLELNPENRSAQQALDALVAGEESRGES